ncbi:hypothetical protein AB0D08_26145 [Kitasatospora sp. NPDC048540]|uniref:hypothetical protein n=1 Tax=Kitasatospora sp. NPDC048540 TaxID=3155634 RepID=UPI0033D455DD
MMSEPGSGSGRLLVFLGRVLPARRATVRTLRLVGAGWTVIGVVFTVPAPLGC